MDKREILYSLLLTKYGLDLNPKADGRVEIPRQLVISSSLDESDTVYISSDEDYIIYISSDKNFAQCNISVSVTVSNGRIRIPSSFLKKINMNNITLVAVHDGAGNIIIKPDNMKASATLDFFVESLSDKHVLELLEILCGCIEDQKPVDIPVKELIVLPVGYSISKPELFKLEYDKDKPIVFRPLGDPYKFKYCLDNGKQKLVRDDSNFEYLFAIPGIKRIKNGFLFGFLILESNLFNQMCRFVICNRFKKDLIFIYNQYKEPYQSDFKIFENPSEELEQSVIKRAELICSNPDKFLLDNFEIFKS